VDTFLTAGVAPCWYGNKRPSNLPVVSGKHTYSGSVVMENITLSADTNSLVITKAGETIDIPLDEIERYVKKPSKTITYSGFRSLETNDARSRIIFVYENGSPYYDFKTHELYHDNGQVFSNTDYRRFPMKFSQATSDDQYWIRCFMSNIQMLSGYSTKRGVRFTTGLCKLDTKKRGIAELFAKHNMLFNNYRIDTEKETFQEMLGVPKCIADMIKSGHSISYQIVSRIQSSYESDPELTESVCELMIHHNDMSLPSEYRLYEFIEIIRAGVPIQNAWEYVHHNIPAQGLQFSNGIRLYHDYIIMCVHMNIEYDKYPRYLHTMHDIMAKNHSIYVSYESEKQYNTIKQEVAAYEYGDKHYCVIVPETIDTIIGEGKALCHCVSSYIDKVLEKKTCIMFMRNTSDPKTPLVTIEIQDNRIVQAKGHSNRGPAPEEQVFLNKYTKYLNTLSESKAA